MFANLFLLLGSLSAPAQLEATQITPVEPTATTAKAEVESDFATRVVGPFWSYASAADYADYLEVELGYYTRVVRSSSGAYYVYYW
jgi:hypothetical protein